MAKMKKKWVALCSSAIGAIYIATYLATDSPANIQQPKHLAQAYTQTEVTQILNTLTPNTQARSSQAPSTLAPSSQVSSTPTPSTQTPSTQTTTIYRDGTYAGEGSNRRGSIQVAVTIKNDKITDVEISNFAMHYSERDVVGLPDEVLQIQSAQVDNVSGATYSTRAFQDAIQEALSLAQNS